MSIAVLSYLQLSTSAANSELVQLKDSQALLAGESGVYLGAKWLAEGTRYDKLKQLTKKNADPYYEDVVPDFTSNGFGVEVDIIKLDDIIYIRSTVASGSELGYNKIIINGATAEPPFPPEAFDCVMFSEGTFDFGGAADLRDPGGAKATVHSNNALVIHGSVNGACDVTSSVSITVKNPITVDGKATSQTITAPAGTFTDGRDISKVPEVPFPEINLAAWRKHAIANGELVTGDFILQAGSYAPNGGVLWVDGNVVIEDGNFKGQVMATGDITVSGKSNIVAPEKGFALASQNGNVTFNGGIIDGLIYTKNGNFRQQGNGQLDGQVIVKGQISKLGTGGTTLYKRQIPVSPGRDSWEDVRLMPGTWRESNNAVTKI
jgi:cytoskeletal protein CcmA (bactofilin family)